MSVNNESGIINIKSYHFINGCFKVIRILLRNWYVLLIAGFLGGIGGYLYGFYDKPKYEAFMTFSLEESGSSGDLMNIAAEFGLNIGSNKSSIFNGENIISIINSRKIIEAVLLQTDSLFGKPATIAENLIEITELNKSWKKHKRLNGVQFPVGIDKKNLTYLQDSALFLLYQDVILKNLTVDKPNKKFNLFEIKFKSPNEAFSMLFVNRLIEETTDFYVTLRTEKSKRILQVLENRVMSLRGSAGSALQGKASVTDANLNPAFAKQGALVQSYQIDASAFGGAYAELFKNLEIARYQFLQDAPLLQILDPVEYPLKKYKKGKLISAIVFAIGLSLLAAMAILFKHAIKKYREINKQ